MVRYGTSDGEVAVGNQTNPLYVSLKNDELMQEDLLHINTEAIVEKDESIEKVINIVKFMKFIHKYINSKGYIYSYEDLCNFYLSLKVKPFVILAGISGTGKSRLVRLFAGALGANMENEKLSIIPVRPDWNDNTELIGYKNITGNFIPGKLIEVIEKASENLDRPYFVCLDEMNLARVEYYLSDYLSIIESRRFSNQGIITDKFFSKNYLNDNKYEHIIIPENLYLIGTVNMDDTTYAFSRKVLDRANTIELSHVELDIFEFNEENLEHRVVHNDLIKSRFLNIKDAVTYDKDYVIKINEAIKNINNILTKANKQFGYRVRDEIVFYMLENKITNLLEEDRAMDYQIMQKVLPTISGSDYKIKTILIELFNICSPNGQISDTMGYIDEAMSYVDNARYINSAKKIVDMLRELDDGFTSYWV